MTYDRPMVERLLPGVWDDSYAYGVQNPATPDPDMPRSKANPSHSNTLYAHLADIKAGWAYAPLSRVERRAVFLRFGLDMTYQEIGRHEGITKKGAQLRAERGIGSITAYLNGEVNAGDTEGQSDY